MAFASQLYKAFDRLDGLVAADTLAGTRLETVLDRYLREVEQSADGDLLASVLLLDADGGRLLHGAAPSLPKAYCDAIHGIGIGPKVGSCGTAAHAGHSIFVTDIATDPLWADFAELALSHGLRACWSTPILSPTGAVIGTFAVYHTTPRAPTAAEIDAVRGISGRVADAIANWSPPPAG